MIVDGAKLIQLRIEAAGDDAAVAHLCRRLGCNGAREQRCPLRIDVEACLDRTHQRRFVCRKHRAEAG